jgi:hypothetical protein
VVWPLELPSRTLGGGPEGPEASPEAPGGLRARAPSHELNRKRPAECRDSPDPGSMAGALICRCGDLAVGVLGSGFSRRSRGPAFIPPSHPRSADQSRLRGEVDRRPRTSPLVDGLAGGPETPESTGVGRGPSETVSTGDPGYRGRLRLRSARGRPSSAGFFRSRCPVRARRWRRGPPSSCRIVSRLRGQRATSVR